MIFPVLLTFWLYLPFGISDRSRDLVTTVTPLTSTFYSAMTGLERGNFVVSPCSLMYAFFLIESGSKGLASMEIIFGHNLHQEDIEDGFRYLTEGFKRTQKIDIRLVNKLYVSKHYEIKETFKQTAADRFEAQVENIDFEKSFTATDTINKWVEDRTEHKIQNLIDTNFVNFNTVAILVNALYFKGNWSNSFQYTDKMTFFVDGTNPKEVETMHLTTKARYYTFKTVNVTTLELPLEGGEATFTIILPHEKSGFKQLETTYRVLAPVLDNKRYFSGYVDVSLPKFKMETTANLRNAGLGMPTMFTHDSDLSGIAGEPGELRIDQMFQKSVISVNERGLGANSASMGVAVRSIVAPEPVKEFRVDRPFMFCVRFKGTVLLAGRVVNPEN